MRCKGPMNIKWMGNIYRKKAITVGKRGGNGTQNEMDLISAKLFYF